MRCRRKTVADKFEPRTIQSSERTRVNHSAASDSKDGRRLAGPSYTEWLLLHKEPVDPDGERISAARQQVHAKRCGEANPRGKRSFDVLRDLSDELPPSDGARPQRLLQIQRSEDWCGNDRNPIRGVVRGINDSP
jgi:hypothetical protein